MFLHIRSIHTCLSTYVAFVELFTSVSSFMVLQLFFPSEVFCAKQANMRPLPRVDRRVQLQRISTAQTLSTLGTGKLLRCGVSKEILVQLVPLQELLHPTQTRCELALASQVTMDHKSLL